MAALEDDPRLQALLRTAERRAVAPLSRRVRAVEALDALLVALVVAALLAWAPGGSDFSTSTALVLFVSMVAASRVSFSVGGGTATPTQPVLVAALLLLPPGAAVALVIGAYLAASLPDCVRRRVHPDHLLLPFGDAWHAVAPALVLALWSPGRPDLGDWPVLVLALLAQFAADGLSSAARTRVAHGMPAPLHLRAMALTCAIDAALAPLGVLAALAAVRSPAAVLLVIPVIGLLAVLGRERERRLHQAVALSDAYRGTALLMGEMLEVDDPYTGGEHSRGVVALALRVGRRLGLDIAEQQTLEFAALLHDIGKLHVPEEILNKSGSLTEEEWAVIRRHPVDGQRMLERVGGVLAAAGVSVRGHHERWDGGGYPDGLARDAIPLPSRIIAACDALSAMTTNRPYRPAMPMEHALAELRACAGSQFDPRVVDAVVAVTAELRAGAPDTLAPLLLT